VGLSQLQTVLRSRGDLPILRTGRKPSVGIVVSSGARRFGGHLLSALLAIVTLGIGYLIWALVLYGRGQTPAKQLLGMRVVKLQTGQRASWGTMFLRDWVCITVVTGLSAFLCTSRCFGSFGTRRTRSLDKMVGDRRERLCWARVAARAALTPRSRPSRRERGCRDRGRRSARL